MFCFADVVCPSLCEPKLAKLGDSGFSTCVITSLKTTAPILFLLKKWYLVAGSVFKHRIQRRLTALVHIIVN